MATSFEKRHGSMMSGEAPQRARFGAPVGEPAEWSDVYEPSRKPASAAANFVSENYLMPGELKSTDDLKPGDGGVLRKGLEKIAVSRDAEGKLHACSAVCTHVGCHVHWNSTEQCWDCPCHGSQFAPTGEALAGPAISPLAKADL
jgi:Rieske Fe-S protein